MSTRPVLPVACWQVQQAASVDGCSCGWQRSNAPDLNDLRTAPGELLSRGIDAVTQGSVCLGNDAAVQGIQAWQPRRGKRNTCQNAHVEMEGFLIHQAGCHAIELDDTHRDGSAGRLPRT